MAVRTANSRLFIHDRQRARRAHTDGADVAVRFVAETIRAGAEQFALGRELHVNFQTDDYFIV